MASASDNAALREGATDNKHDGVYSAEIPGRVTPTSIDAIGPNGKHPFTSGVSATGPFKFGKVPTKSQN
jgi:hypothetical protein